MPYILRCVICSYQDTAEDVDTVFDIIDAHQDERGEEHHVNFEMVEEKPFLRGGDPDTNPYL